MPNLKDVDETPYNYSAQEVCLSTPTASIPKDSCAPRPRLLVADEYGPSLVHVDRTGKVVKRYIPEGLKLEGVDYLVAHALPAIYGKRKINRGFEGLTLSADEKTLYVALQSPLLNPDPKTGNASRNTRVLVFDIAGEEVTAEYVYASTCRGIRPQS